MNTTIKDDPDESEIANKCKYVDIEDIQHSLCPNTFSHKVMHYNIRSLNENFDKLKFLMEDLDNSQLDLDFLLLCETFLNDKNSNLYNLPGYTVAEKHRVNAKGGGVAIFVKNKFQYKIREDLSIFDEGLFESVFIEASINNKNVVIGEIYRPPNSNINQFIERYSNLIMKITDEKKEFIIGSDHNLDLIKYENNMAIQECLDQNHSNGILPVIDKPTRITHKSATLIDNLFTNIKTPHQSGIIYSYISDHFPIVLLLGQKTHSDLKSQPMTLTYRKMTDLTIIAMNQELQAIDWNAGMENMDTTASFNFLIDNINLAINHHCPEKI